MMQPPPSPFTRLTQNKLAKKMELKSLKTLPDVFDYVRDLGKIYQVLLQR